MSSYRTRAEAGIKQRGHFDITEVKASVNIVDIIGMFVPLKRSGREYKGHCPFHSDRDPSFTVVPHLGDHGQFKCFPCGAHGDVIDFVTKIKGCDIRTACQFLVGDAALEFMDVDRARLKAEAKKREQKEAADNEEKRRKAYSIWNSARPIAGSPAEAYLAGRGITGPLPPGLRFHPDLFCAETGSSRLGMLAAMVDARGTFQALHRTYLGRNTNGLWVKASLENPKKILGKFGGSAIRIYGPGDPVAGSTLWIAEGIETALSVRAGLQQQPELARDACVWAAASLINLSRLALPADQAGKVPFKTVILCMDADMDRRLARTEELNAELTYGGRGCEVRVCYPPEGMDFNDQLRASGAVTGAA